MTYNALKASRAICYRYIIYRGLGDEAGQIYHKWYKYIKYGIKNEG